MSDSQAYEEVTLSSNGVTVVKRFEEDEFPVPAIAFEFTSDRDEAVTVRLVDTVPDGVAVEDLGFHPEYGSEYWTIDEDEITFERELGANAEYTTVYGIRATGTDDVEQFLTEPDLASVDPPLPDDEEEEVIPESDDDVVRDVISGETDDVPGLEDEEGEETDEDIETLDLKDPNESGEAQQASSESDDDDDTEGGDGGTGADDGAADVDVDLDGENLVSALAAEIRQNNVSADDVKLLRQAFEIAGQEGGSIAARLDRVQKDVSNLRAYTDAMEEFLDDNGTAQQLVADIESDIDTLEETLSSMESTVQSNDSEIDSLSSQVEDMEGEVSAVREEVDDVHAEVDDVHDEVDEIAGDFDDVETTVEDLESAVGDIEDSLEDLQDQVSDEDLGDRLEDIEDDLDDLQEWQEQIKATFGG